MPDLDPLGLAAEWLVTFGLAGLLALLALERIVPVLPSYPLLIGAGMHSAEGTWRLCAALSATTLGSVLGCIVIYSLGKRLGERKMTAAVNRSGWLIGIAERNVDALVGYFRRHEILVGLTAQLVPVARLIAPGVGGFIASRPLVFATATIAGAAIWNAAFIALGFAAHRLDATGNLSLLTAAVVAALVGGQAAAVGTMRLFRR